MEDLLVLNIVVVDDVKSVSASIKRELTIASKKNGYHFKIAEFQDPEVALNFIRKEPVHLLITDIKMPYLMGDKLVEAIKKVKPNLPVLVLTGFATRENILSIAHADSKSIVITKPWEPEKLIEAVNKLLGLDMKLSD